MKVISVKFKESGRAYYFDPKELEIKEGEFVIVETARGVECGEVVRSAHEIASGSFPREDQAGHPAGGRRGCAPHAPEPCGRESHL